MQLTRDKNCKEIWTDAQKFQKQRMRTKGISCHPGAHFIDSRSSDPISPVDFFFMGSKFWADIQACESKFNQESSLVIISCAYEHLSLDIPPTT